MDNPFISSDVKLTIGMLVSNRIQYIRKVMEGIKPLLKHIPSELIVIDTKGEEGDGSIEIAREYTDKIYPFAWCNDFSKARNVIFEHAKGEWFLALDDDEVFEEAEDLIAFFQSDEIDKYYTGNFPLRNYDAEGNYTVSNPVRLFRRTKETRYIGAVHEYISDAKQPTKSFSSIIHHYGYAFQNIEEAQKHQERNANILRKELETCGYTPHLCAQMTQELIYLESSAEKGMEFAKSALEILEKEQKLTDPSSQYVIYATVLYYLRKQEAKEAEEQMTSLENQYPLLELTKLVFSGIRAQLALEQKNLQGMLQYSLEYTAWWDWKEKEKTKAEIQKTLSFNQYCTKEYYYHMLHIGAAAANELEWFRTAQSFWNRMNWKEEGFDGTMYQQDLSSTLRGYKRAQLLQKQYPDIMQRLDLLERANNEAEILENSGQSDLACEYRQAMKQLLEALYTMLEQVLSEKATSIVLLKEILSGNRCFKITAMKETIQLECVELLNNNSAL